MIGLKLHFEMEIAHRLKNSYSTDCHENLHGHSYKVDLEIQRKDKNLNEFNMVCDFKKIKEVLKRFEKKYDHSTILQSEDPLVPVISTYCKKFHIWDKNPTAEEMTVRYFKEIQDLFDEDNLEIEITAIYIGETTNNVAFLRK